MSSQRRPIGPPSPDLTFSPAHPGRDRVREDTRPILVAVDGSGSADWGAVEWAAAEAAARGCPLRIVYARTWPVVIDPFGSTWIYHDDEGDREAGELLLLGAEQRAREVASDLRLSIHHHVGTALSVLRWEGRRHSLIVIDRGQPRGWLGALAGSPAAAMARHAECPIAVIGPTAGAPAGPSAARVVVGLDGAGECPERLGFAFRTARRRGLGLTAVHAWQPSGSARLPASTDAGRHRQLDRTLTPWCQLFPDVDVVARSVQAPAPQALLAESAGAALLVVGTHRGPRRARLGPVTRAVLRCAPSPVSVVRG